VYCCGIPTISSAVAVTASRAIAVGNAINECLRANANELMKKTFDGQVIEMSIAGSTPAPSFSTS
jgi:hypothetical protein